MRADAESGFLRSLCSEGPAMPEHARIFAPFVGSWDLIVRWFDHTGTVIRELPGEWHFAWVLDGRGMQDVWIVPPRDHREAGDPYEHGTSIRFYDPDLDAWQSTWIGPMHRIVRTFTARKRGDTVVLETSTDVSPALRWSFCDIAADSFNWRNEVWDEEAWHVQQTFEARRRVP